MPNESKTDVVNDSAKPSTDVTASVHEGTTDRGIFARRNLDDLKGKSIRGGVVAMVAQGIKFVLQTGSMMILARLLSPEDFGLQGMVVAMTGVLALFKDAGLSLATVQREVVTHEQVSTLFWINVGVGTVLTILAAGLSPALTFFYHEPRLFWVVIVSATAFLINGLGTQHQALLQRALRFVTIAKIEILSLAVSSALGIGMALLGCGYWALVGMAVSSSLIGAVGAWIAIPWLPGLPRRQSGIRSMLHFGGTVTLNGLVVYLGYNAEKILLGRFWGAEALGLYGRAYQLINLPVQQLNASIYGVAFSALSRIQHDNERLCRLFRRGYAILLSMTIPVTICCAIFSEEIVYMVLGPKWGEATPVFRLLVPTVLGFALINPFGWFLVSSGRAVRSLRMAFLIAPTVILGVLAGLSHGPKGVATGFSAAVALLVVPIIIWAIHGTGITIKDYWQTTRPPVLSGLLAAAAGLVPKMTLDMLTPIPRLICGVGVVLCVYAFILLVVMRQSGLYLDLVQQVFHRAPIISPKR